MRKNIMIVLTAFIVLLVVAAIGANILLTPQYKTIDLNGYKMEVPASNANITSLNDNYKVYDDNEHNITIKSYAINNANETNYTGAIDLAAQLGNNTGQNTTIENKTVINNSGRYAYSDVSNYQMIVISSDNYDTMDNILKTLNKTEIRHDEENLTINLMTISNNTTDTSNTTASTSTGKTNTKKSSSGSDDDGYHYSAQYGTYIKEWNDGDGEYHMKSRDGKWEESYNEKTGKFKSKSPYGYEENYM